MDRYDIISRRSVNGRMTTKGWMEVEPKENGSRGKERVRYRKSWKGAHADGRHGAISMITMVISIIVEDRGERLQETEQAGRWLRIGG